jgi:phosphopantothenoylcysteine decarboxylase/phosphopantothenate--cysteine ligase
VAFVGPDEGAMACGEFGEGRMAEPAAIFAADHGDAGRRRRTARAGKRRAIVTAGPTAEPIDPVRVITNRSSGKQGYAIAAGPGRARRRRHPGQRPDRAPRAGRRDAWRSTSRREMLAACEAALPADIAVCVAAVADWRPNDLRRAQAEKGQERTRAT